MEPKISLLCSFTTAHHCPCPGPDGSSPHLPIIFLLRSILVLSSHLHPSISRGHLPSGFRTKVLYAFLTSPMYATCPAHLILLNLITLILFGEIPNYEVFFSLLTLPLRPKYSPQHPVLKHPQTIFFL